MINKEGKIGIRRKGRKGEDKDRKWEFYLPQEFIDKIEYLRKEVFYYSPNEMSKILEISYKTYTRVIGGEQKAFRSDIIRKIRNFVVSNLDRLDGYGNK